MALKYIVTLTREERESLEQLVAKGIARARKLTRARILLKVDSGEFGPALSDEEVCDALDTSPTTVYRVRQRFITGGVETAIERQRGQRVYVRRLDGAAEAKLVTLACSRPPEGYGRWTMRLLADHLVELGVVDAVSYETVRVTLKKKRAQAVVEEGMGDLAGA